MGISIYDDNFDFLENLSFDNIAPDALNKAAPILQNSLKRAVKAALYHEGESELVDSISRGPIKQCSNQAWIVNIVFKGYSKGKTFTRKRRSYPVSNALKAIWKEYGIAGRQVATPFLARAHEEAEEAVLKTMQEVFNEKVDT